MGLLAIARSVCWQKKYEGMTQNHPKPRIRQLDLLVFYISQRPHFSLSPELGMDEVTFQGMAVADAAASCGAEEGDGDESAGGIGAELEAGNIFMGFIYYHIYN